jgi:hypothetical protein
MQINILAGGPCHAERTRGTLGCHAAVAMYTTIPGTATTAVGQDGVNRQVRGGLYLYGRRAHTSDASDEGRARGRWQLGDGTMMTAGRGGRWQVGGRATMTALPGWSIVIAEVTHIATHTVIATNTIGAANHHAEVVANIVHIAVAVANIVHIGHVGGNAVQRVLTVSIQGRGRAHAHARGFLRTSTRRSRKHLQYRGIVVHAR